ncbi:MAG: hypothetical protein IKX83_02070 [Clostridia bacterium]|nr:hypothetical protein [Clostridia bacterium]
MRKSIAAILTALAMIVALVVPMTAFADEGAPAGKSAKTYDESFKATKDEPEYDVVVDDEEDVDVDVSNEEEVTLVVDVDDDDVSLIDSAKAKANELSAKIKAIDIDLPDGEFDIDYDLSGGAWKLAAPAKLFVKDGKSYARMTFNNPDLEKIIFNGKEILPTKWVNVDGIKGKLPVFDIPVLAWGALKGFDLYDKAGNVESYNFSLKEYDPNFKAPEFNPDLTAEGEKVLNYVDSNNGAHHVLSPSDTRVSKESKLKLNAPIAVLIGEALVGAVLLLRGIRHRNQD